MAERLSNMPATIGGEIAATEENNAKDTTLHPDPQEPSRSSNKGKGKRKISTDKKRETSDDFEFEGSDIAIRN
jgi:hypothetical protein